MATVGAKAKRRAIVQQRLADSMTALADRLGIEAPADGPPVRDTDLAAIIGLERQADILDAVNTALDQRGEGGDPIVSEVSTDAPAADPSPAPKRAKAKVQA